MEISDSDIIGPASDTGAPEAPSEVTDSQILGPADGPGETKKLDAGPDSTRKLPRQEKTMPLGEAVERTAPPESPEKTKELRDGQIIKIDAIRQDMAHSAGEAALMVPMGEPAESPEEAEIRRLADEARELAEQAEAQARETSIKALAGLEVGSAERLDRAVEFLGKWPDNGKEFADSGLTEAEQAIIALRFAKDNPKDFVRVMENTDLCLSTDEKAAIAEEIRDSAPAELPRALSAMRLPTEHVSDIIRGVDPKLRSQAFKELGIPEVGQELAGDVSASLEAREREDSKMRQFREVANAVSLEVMRSFPERLNRERERNRIENELGGKMTEARDFGETAAAPMVIRLEGRELPAIYKATAREVASRQEFAAKNGQDLRPGIEAETVPNREWLAYQIDKALQLDVVPTTVMREGPAGIGSVQDWQVSEGLHDKPYFRWAKEDAGFRNELAKVAFLDRAIENTDRHQKNFLRSPDGKVIAIDNGLSQARPDSLSDHVQSFPIYALEGQEIPPALLQAAERLESNPALQGALQKAFDAALGKDSKRAWKAFNSRLKDMRTKGQFPTTTELEGENNHWHKMNRDRIMAQRQNIDTAA